MLLVEPRSLDGGRSHLGEMDRGGFVVFSEGMDTATRYVYAVRTG